MDNTQREHRAGLIEAHRLDGFFDAAFAFAVSILAIAGTEVPHDLHHMLNVLNRIPAYACSFATLLVFWYRHVRWRERCRVHDQTSVVYSLMLVFFALIFVYPLNMVFSAMFNAIYSGFTGRLLAETLVIGTVHDMNLLYSCYGLAYMCMTLCLAALYRHSVRHMHNASREERIEARESLYTQLGAAGVALLSIVLAWLLPEGGLWIMLPGLAYGLLTLVYSLAGRWARRTLEAAA
ncbi:TMEM175 family protein [Dyella sp.]|uniref:TMEM175 family protein n=1 Tax=Dyella sp. TaxID=1869338 RepID=UPI002ED68C86